MNSRNSSAARPVRQQLSRWSPGSLRRSIAPGWKAEAWWERRHGQFTTRGRRRDFIVVRSPDRYPLAGPQPAETADHRLWHVGFAADAPLHLQVRRLDNGSNSPPVLTMRLKERQQLMPDGLEAEYGFEFESVHQDGVG